MPHPLSKKIKLAPGAERSLSVTLKSLRNPPLDISLTSQALSTSILDLKEEVTAQTSIPSAKLRVLYKKPVPDSKILKELVGDDESKMEFSIMVLGGAASVKKSDEEVIPVEGAVAQGVSGKEVLAKEEFWGDLKGWLVQRLRDEGEAERVFGVFRGALEGKK
jgi:hypothetical protein